jgi:succinate-acetate transporter protein
MRAMSGESTLGWAPGGPATLFLLGVLHIGLFAFATSGDRSVLAPVLGLWILGVSVPLLILAVIEMRRGELLFGTMGLVFGGLLGLGGGLSFVRGLFLPGPSAMDGYWFLGTSFVFFLLIPSMWRISRLVALSLVDIGLALFILGLSLAGFLGTDQLPLIVAGWLALLFSLSCYYVALAQITNAIYGRKVLPF